MGGSRRRCGITQGGHLISNANGGRVIASPRGYAAGRTCRSRARPDLGGQGRSVARRVAPAMHRDWLRPGLVAIAATVPGRYAVSARCRLPDAIGGRDSRAPRGFQPCGQAGIARRLWVSGSQTDRRRPADPIFRDAGARHLCRPAGLFGSWQTGRPCSAQTRAFHSAPQERPSCAIVPARTCPNCHSSSSH
jgi:hypothetical protein